MPTCRGRGMGAAGQVVHHPQRAATVHALSAMVPNGGLMPKSSVTSPPWLVGDGWMDVSHVPLSREISGNPVLGDPVGIADAVAVGIAECVHEDLAMHAGAMFPWQCRRAGGCAAGGPERRTR